VCHESFSDMCGMFCAVGCFVLWDVLCRETFSAVGRLVMGPLVMGRF
jgi:hypothetical protein